MKVLVVEDEAPAARRLKGFLERLLPGATLLGPCDTVTTAVALLNEHNPDLLICDIALADGLSFRIWEETAVKCSTIFVTAYEQYAIRAFRVNSLDYLLKPVKEEELAAALERFTATQPALLPPTLMHKLLAAVEAKQHQYRSRILTSQGRELVPMHVDEIAHFYSEDRLCFSVSKTGKTLLVSESISKLAEELNPNDWFQINRGQLVHIDSIAKASPYLNHRLKLSLKPAIANQSNVVARERVAEFKTWMAG